MNLQEAISKAKKLLAKGNDKAISPEESAAFLAKAQQIITDYQLDVNSFEYDKNQAADDAEPVQDFGFEDPLDRVKYGQYRETWTRRLAAILAHANQTQTVYQQHADKSISIKIIGRGSDVQLVRYLYGFFKLQVEQLAGEACTGHSSAFRGQFCMGVLDTLYNKLESERARTVAAKKTELTGNSTALVRVDQALERIEKRKLDVKTFVAQNLKLGKGRNYHAKTETGGRYQGQIAGEKLRMTGAKGAIGSEKKQIS